MRRSSFASTLLISIALGLNAGSRLKAADGFRAGRPELPEVVPHDGVAPLKAEPGQFLMQPDRRDVGKAGQKRSDFVAKRIEHAFRLAFVFRQRARPLLLMFVNARRSESVLTSPVNCSARNIVISVSRPDPGRTASSSPARTTKNGMALSPLLNQDLTLSNITPLAVSCDAADLSRRKRWEYLLRPRTGQR